MGIFEVLDNELERLFLLRKAALDNGEEFVSLTKERKAILELLRVCIIEHDHMVTSEVTYTETEET